MRVPRIYHSEPIAGHSTITLDDAAANHISRVLRMTQGEALILFDGSNQIYPAVIEAITKKTVQVSILRCEEENRESPLYLHLGQVVSRGERMNFTIQKSVELGVNMITPVMSDRCNVKRDHAQYDKKVAQWQKIAIAACEQCGRNTVPLIRPVTPLQAWCEAQEEQPTVSITLNPKATQTISQLPVASRIRLLIGAEGGLTDKEIAMTKTHHFTDVFLGHRILRTETAALAAITALQVRFGDL